VAAKRGPKAAERGTNAPVAPAREEPGVVGV